MKTITSKENVHYLPLKLEQPFTFWKYVINEWCQCNNVPLITHKLVKQIYEKICHQSISNITCSNKITMSINKEFLIIKKLV